MGVATKGARDASPASVFWNTELTADAFTTVQYTYKAATGMPAGRWEAPDQQRHWWLHKRPINTQPGALDAQQEPRVTSAVTGGPAGLFTGAEQWARSPRAPSNAQVYFRPRAGCSGKVWTPEAVIEGAGDAWSWGYAGSLQSDAVTYAAATRLFQSFLQDGTQITFALTAGGCAPAGTVWQQWAAFQAPSGGSSASDAYGPNAVYFAEDFPGPSAASTAAGASGQQAIGMEFFNAAGVSATPWCPPWAAGATCTLSLTPVAADVWSEPGLAACAAGIPQGLPVLACRAANSALLSIDTSANPNAYLGFNFPVAAMAGVPLLPEVPCNRAAFSPRYGGRCAANTVQYLAYDERYWMSEASLGLPAGSITPIAPPPLHGGCLAGGLTRSLGPSSPWWTPPLWPWDMLYNLPSLTAYVGNASAFVATQDGLNSLFAYQEPFRVPLTRSSAGRSATCVCTSKRPAAHAATSLHMQCVPYCSANLVA